MSRPAIDIARMTPDERLALIEELWESLSEAERDAIPLSADQQRELDRRLDELERGDSSQMSPAEMRERVQRRSS